MNHVSELVTYFMTSWDQFAAHSNKLFIISVVLALFFILTIGESLKSESDKGKDAAYSILNRLSR